MLSQADILLISCKILPKNDYSCQKRVQNPCMIIIQKMAILSIYYDKWNKNSKRVFLIRIAVRNKDLHKIQK